MKIVGFSGPFCSGGGRHILDNKCGGGGQFSRTILVIQVCICGLLSVYINMEFATRQCDTSNLITLNPGGGGGVLAFEMGRGVPPACLKPDPVPIRLAAKKTPCPNLKNI